MGSASCLIATQYFEPGASGIVAGGHIMAGTGMTGANGSTPGPSISMPMGCAEPPSSTWTS